MVQQIENSLVSGVGAGTGGAARAVAAEVAVLHVADGVLESQAVRRLVLVEVPSLQHFFPVVLVEPGEEDFELLLPVVQSEELLDSLVVEQLVFPVVLRIPGVPFGAALLGNLTVPSEEQFSKMIENGPVQLLQSPVFSDPNDTRQVVESDGVILVHVDDNFGPSRVDAVVIVVLVQRGHWRQLGVKSMRNLVNQADATRLGLVLLDGHLTIEDGFDLLIVDPSEDHVAHGPPVSVLQLLPQVVQSLVVFQFHFELEVLVLIVYSILHEEALDINVVDINNWHRNHEERIESDTDAVAAGAGEFGFVLAVEQVANDAFVSEDVLVPRLVTGFLVRLAVGFGLLYVRLLFSFVEVFRDEVQDGVDALLRVVLPVALEGHVVLA